MSDARPTYDLMLMLDPSAADEQKTKILADTEAAIAKGGELIGKHDYGLRPTAFEVKKKKEAGCSPVPSGRMPRLARTDVSPPKGAVRPMAASNINRVVLTGNLTFDPDLRSLPSGMSVCKLRIAVNTRRKDGATGEWVDKP